MSTGAARVESRSGDALPQPAPLSVRIYVVVPARVKTWLDEEAARSGLAVSAVVRQLLTRASSSSSSSPHA